MCASVTLSEHVCTDWFVDNFFIIRMLLKLTQATLNFSEKLSLVFAYIYENVAQIILNSFYLVSVHFILF